MNDPNNLNDFGDLNDIYDIYDLDDLIDLYTHCEVGLRQVPMLTQQLAQLKEEIREIKEYKVSDISNVSTMEFEYILNEMQERQKRMSNIIITNIREPALTNFRERKEQNIQAIRNILRPIGIEETIPLNVFRLGKYEENKHRPLKVMFTSNEQAITVLKNKSKINTPGIKIFGDQTKKQKEYFMSLKQKIRELEESGDNTKFDINSMESVANNEQDLAENFNLYFIRSIENLVTNRVEWNPPYETNYFR
ncbi:hypothetical protein NQ318_010988 [Aromia moschata]|uniref:Uncharacterized protein n=1 Tax=Aromia moschata TaxID=1265417 RepID=A0AAV8YN31_9CUCU|nr:hypothetical protein NQ318_010988 [Aromia moschata]